MSSITCQIFGTKGVTTVPEVRIAAGPRTEFGNGAARGARDGPRHHLRARYGHPAHRPARPRRNPARSATNRCSVTGR
jgi:hypothetical protein